MIHHPTQLETFQICPRKYQYDIVDGIKPEYVNWWALRGTIIHKTFEAGFQAFSKLYWDEINQSPKPIHKARTVEISRAELQTEHDNLSLILPNYWVFLNRFAIEVKEREKTFNWKYLDRDFEGTVDAIAVHPDTPDGMVEIHDYKSGKKWGEHALNRKLQFALYFNAAFKAGYKVNRVFWCHVKDLTPYKHDSKITGAKAGDLRGQFLYPVKISLHDDASVTSMVEPILRSIEASLFPMTGASSGHCALCPYADKPCPRFSVGYDEAKDTMIKLQQSLMQRGVK